MGTMKPTKTRVALVAGEPISAWRSRIRRASRRDRRAMIEHLGQRGLSVPDEAAACAELAMLGFRDKDCGVVGAAVGAVHALLRAKRTERTGDTFIQVARAPHLLPLAKRAATQLAAAAKSAWPDNRCNAYLALAALEIPSQRATAALFRGTRDPDPQCRGFAVAGLGALGAGRDAVARVAEVAGNAAETQQVRVYAVSALGRQKSHALARKTLEAVARDRRIGSRLRLFTQQALSHAENGSRPTRPGSESRRRRTRG
jgi:hypothetical protein